MSIVEKIRAAANSNPSGTKLAIPLSMAEEFTAAVLRAGAGAEFKTDVCSLQVKTFLGLEFIGVSAYLADVKVF